MMTQGIIIPYDLISANSVQIIDHNYWRGMIPQVIFDNGYRGNAPGLRYCSLSGNEFPTDGVAVTRVVPQCKCLKWDDEQKELICDCLYREISARTKNWNKKEKPDNKYSFTHDASMLWIKIVRAEKGGS